MASHFFGAIPIIGVLSYSIMIPSNHAQGLLHVPPRLQGGDGLLTLVEKLEANNIGITKNGSIGRRSCPSKTAAECAIIRQRNNCYAADCIVYEPF